MYRHLQRRRVTFIYNVFSIGDSNLKIKSNLNIKIYFLQTKAHEKKIAKHIIPFISQKIASKSLLEYQIVRTFNKNHGDTS